MSSAQVPEGYKQTEVGVIPEDWDVQKVSEAFEIRNNLRLPINRKVRESMEGQYPYYGPTNVQGYINEYRIEGEHALIGEDGDHFLKWRDLSMTLLVDGKFNVNNHAHVVKGVTNLTPWFYYFFANKELTTYLTRQGAGRYKLTKNALENIPCAIPPLPEQQTIAQALSDVDALIASLDKLIAKQRQLKTAAMQQLLTGKMRSFGFGEGMGYKQTEVGLIPEDWKTEELGCLGNFKNGINKSSEDFGHGLPFVNLMDVFGISSISEVKHLGLVNSNEAERNVYDLKEGDVLFIRSSVKQSGVGLTTVIEKYLPKTVYSGFLIRFRDNGNLETNFKKYCFSEENFRQSVISNSTVSANTNINQDNLKKLILAYPESSREQDAIATVLSDIDTAIAALEIRRAKTQAIKQGMMQELLTGRTRLV
jgi:type I restriction enzyme, S subunit